MDCNCDYDPPTFHSEVVRRSRKHRKCYECGAEIAIGSQYQYSTGLWDGNFNAFTWCLNCVAARDVFVKNSECACWAYGNLWDDMENEWREDGGKMWLGRIIVGRKKRWQGVSLSRVFAGKIE